MPMSERGLGLGGEAGGPGALTQGSLIAAPLSPLAGGLGMATHKGTQERAKSIPGLNLGEEME